MNNRSHSVPLKELCDAEAESVHGGIIPFLIGLGKGIGYGIAAGSALYGVALAAYHSRES